MPRTKNTEFEKLGFSLIKEQRPPNEKKKSKYFAYCGVCKKNLTNTAASRLKSHRKVCRLDTDGCSPATTSSLTSSVTSSTCSSTANECSDKTNEIIREPEKTLITPDSALAPEIFIEIDDNVDLNDVVNNMIDVDHDYVQLHASSANLFTPVSIVSSSSGLSTPTENSSLDFVTRNTSSSASSNRSTPLEVMRSNREKSLRSSSSRSRLRDTCSIDSPSPSSISSSSRSCTPIRSTTTSTSIKSSATANKRKVPSVQRSLTQFVDCMSSNEVNKITEKLCDFFFGCNIPFSVVESKHFKALINELRPAFEQYMPSRKVLSTRLLDETHERHEDKIRKRFSGTECSLLVDGWKNEANNTKTVVTMLHGAMNKERAFLKAWDFTLDRETALNLSEVINNSIALAKSKYNVDAYAVVPDNAANMLAMGRTVAIWHSNCMSHTGNLYAKDVLDGELNKKVVKVLKEFKNSELEKLVVNSGGRRMQTPIDTRWCTYRDAYQSYISNLEYMSNIAVRETNRRVPQDVKNLLVNDSFNMQVKNDIDFFDPICKLINRCQDRKTSISEGTALWLKLKKPEEPNLDELEEQDDDRNIAGDESVAQKRVNSFYHRRNMAITKYSLSAYFLDPRYYNQLMQTIKAMEEGDIDAKTNYIVLQNFMLDNLDDKGVIGFYKYQKKTDIFETLFEKNVTDPMTFWGMVEPHYRSLAKMAMRLINIPASSAEIERLFSSWSFVHNKKRNRLSFDKSEKLLFVYYSLKIEDSNNSDDY